MWCETSGPRRGTTPGPDLGIHLGMGGRIVVASPGGSATEGGGPRRRDAPPGKPEWNRFVLEFADGGSLTLVDKRRLGRVRLNPDIDALGPDAVRDHASGIPRPDQDGNHRGQGPPARSVQDRRNRQPAGRRAALEGQGAAIGAGRRPAARRCRPAVPGLAVCPGLRSRQRRRAHRRRHPGAAPGRDMPALRRRDEARSGGRAVDLVVLARAGLTGGARPGPGPARTGSRP